MKHAYLLDRLNIFFSRLTSLQGQAGALHHARFALAHELQSLTSHSLDEEALLLGRTHLGGIYRVRKTPNRRELGNILIEAPTGGGKGLLAVSQILTWGSSAVIFDIKGDLYKQTAGYRATLGPVYRFDTRGCGNTYDPLHGKHDSDELYDIAHQLLYEPNEGEGKGFTQKGIKMLTIVFQAGREANRKKGKPDAPLLPFVGHMADLGVNRAAQLMDAISPDLARRFLDDSKVTGETPSTLIWA